MTVPTPVLTRPNSTPEITQRVTARQVTWGRTLAMLPARIGLFVLFQALIAAIYALQGNPAPWDASVAWWIVVATLTNLVCIGLLARLTRREGFRLIELYKGDRRTFRRDVLISIGLFVVMGPVAFLPNMLAGNLLFGDVAVTMDMMFRPLPLWVAALSMLLFPVTIAFAELPTYFGYVMPRLEGLSGRKWLAVLLPALFLAAQHSALPLIFDARFILWRFLMFLPLALLVAVTLHWRPRLLPYMMVIHALMDVMTAAMVLAASM